MTKKLSASAVAILASFSASLVLVAAQATEILQRPAPVDLMSLIDDDPMSLSGEMEVFIHLDMPSVAEFCANEVAAGRPVPSSALQRAHAAKVDAQQAGMRGTLASYGARELSTLRVGVNGFRVKVDVSRLTEIRNLAGVRTVGRVETFVPDLENSIPWIGADALHASGIDGAGVSVAIIDTGIDYYHANFGGAGNPADYAADDPTIIEVGTFPTARVVIGTDFVGGCDVGTSGCVITPDPDPLDVNFHGSHVAGIAGGNGVLGSIGPGVAPAVDLWALKVFGDVAISTNAVSEAIEFALDPNGDGDMSDHADVINMSLGSSFGDPNSPSALASQNAAEVGIIVVASAGNSGDVPYVTGSPAVAPAVISVAASITGGLLASSFEVTSNAGLEGFYENLEAAFTPRLEDVGPVAGDLVVADPLNGCVPLVNAADVAGNIALIQRGACRFDTKGTNAEAAGAIAFVVFNNQAGAGPIVMGGNPIVFIPGVMLGTDDGGLLATAEGGGADVEVNLDVAPAPQNDDNLAGFSSRGPGHGSSVHHGIAGSQFKPDITAPGVSIVSTLVGSGSGATTASGTSMSAPHTAGLAALMHANNPSLTPFEIKAIMQNTSEVANVDGTGGVNPYPLARQGTGVIRANRAISATAVAIPGGLSFGRINPSRHFRSKRHVHVRDLNDQGHHGHHGGTHRTFAVTHVPNQTFPGVTVSCPSTVHVGPHSQSGFNIRLTMDPTVGPFDDAFHSQTEVDGWCVLDDGTDQLRVGYLAVVDPASKMKVHRAKDGVNIRNRRGNLGWAEGFTLAGRGGELLDGTPNAIAKFGFRTGSFAAAGDLVEFGIAMERPWETLAAYEYDILVDVNEDGITDFVLVAADFFDDGRPVTAIFPQGAALFFTGADLNDATAVMTFFGATDAPLGFLGFLPPGDTDFDYTLITFDLRDGSFDVQEGSVDLNDEIVPAFNSFGLFPGTDVDVPTSGNGKMLWLFQNNNAKRGGQADTVFIHRRRGHH